MNYKLFFEFLMVSFILVLTSSCVKDLNEDTLGEYFLEPEPVDDTCTSLSDEDFTTYNIPNVCTKDIYTFDFGVDDDSWFTGSQSGCRLRFDDGAYVGECDGTNFYLSCRRCDDRPTPDNYQLEVEILIEEDGNTCSLNWGAEGIFESVYRFGISKTGRYLIAHNKAGESQPALVPFTNFAAIKADDFNKLTIRKIGTQTHFFINEVYCTTLSNLVPYGNQVNLRVGDQSRCRFDNFKYQEILR